MKMGYRKIIKIIDSLEQEKNSLTRAVSEQDNKKLTNMKMPAFDDYNTEDDTTKRMKDKLNAEIKLVDEILAEIQNELAKVSFDFSLDDPLNKFTTGIKLPENS